MTKPRIILLTLCAMIAFASNSLLCRAALKNTGIDAASFTSIRLLSGAIALWLIVAMRRNPVGVGGNWTSAFALFAYAAAFSFAYRYLSAGTGALLLFGAVQATMIFWGVTTGERLRLIQLAGISLALAGLIVLVFPGLTAPSLSGSLLMIGAGVAWGVYSLRGKGVTHPIAATAGNFLRSIPFVIIVSLAAWPWAHFNRAGILYSVISGAITSGLGYVIWYQALPGLNATSAATVQLSVPVLAAAGGIFLLHEPLTVRFLLASVAVLGGIALVVLEKKAPSALPSVTSGQG